MRKPIMVDLICSLFILLFLYTALSKLFDYASFRRVLQRSPLLEHVAPMMAWGLPLFEIGIALLLFFPAIRLTGLYATLITLLVFTGYLTYMITVTPLLPCSCGGVLKQLSWRQHLVFNSVCILIAWVGIRTAQSIRKRNLVSPGFPPRPDKMI